MERRTHSLKRAGGNTAGIEPVAATNGLRPKSLPATLFAATPLEHSGRKGPVPKRRYQEGTLREENGRFYSFFYRDRRMPDGNTRSVKERFDHGKIGEVSELSARREHDRLRHQINRERGSVPPAPRGESFADAANLYKEGIAPHLADSTVRQQQSHLRCHLIPRFGAEALMSLDVQTVQRFTTEMLGRRKARKTIINVVGTLFAILEYARKCGMRVPETTLAALMIKPDRGDSEAPYFRPEDAAKIVAAAREPYKTVFALAWCTGLRAGELLGLRVADIDFQRRLIQPCKQADDSTRQLRELKTRRSNSAVAMTQDTAALLTGYLKNHWRENPEGLLFPNRNMRPLKREYVVKFGLKPLLRKLGLPVKDVGLHAFRHGLGTALSNSKVSPKTVQQILRHADIKTTFRYYVHSDIDAQRSALETVQLVQRAD